jgi:tetratricopeptide (TPR) repeat protein
MSKKHDFEIAFFESVLRKNPKYTEVIEILGELYTRTGRIEDGLRMDRRLVRLLPDDANAYYNLACSLALKKRNTEALATLKKAVSLGYSDIDWLLQDPDLETLKKLPAFKRLVTKIDAATN